ncbi:MFS multidrug transporter, putative [Talaromyces stipitatus ATCC 10500]|uniref:MFS multidrug transporter, putative n=1 Tax=Talaromyces stipitatus (strain ATCC 10500 / CBS 375.48 / QM 6759 / NRRL 1006) TaxID=441959 RepID=B8M909_TALSN|nr:MFS multidrug transporter, putative [Talaromyces stipitatus ATCC 10500]EED17304.1 MFS multidrug transporter, putative [Talaromyces stipitatus ATCC 10500]
MTTPQEESGPRQGEQLRNPNDRPECFSSTLQECLFVLTTTMAIAQTSFFEGLVLVVSASIGEDLNMSSAEITWITAGVSLTSGAFLLAFGKVADMFGRRIMFMASMAGFTVALVIAGFANAAIYMDVFSGVMGIFCASAVPPAVGSLGVVYSKPSKRKNRAFACFSAGNPLGYVGGMIISGIASQVGNWRIALWTLAVIYAIFTLLAVWTVPSDPPKAKAELNWQSMKKLDPIGMLLAISGIALFSTALSTAGDASNGWKTPYVILLLVLGVVLIAGFLSWESIYSTPLMPLYVWQDRNFSLLMGSLCLGFMGFISSEFWMALYMQQIKHYSPLEITARLLPMIINGILVNVVCGLILHKVSNKLLMLIGATAYMIAFLIMSFTPDDGIYWGWYLVPLLLMVVGADTEFNVVNSSIVRPVSCRRHFQHCVQVLRQHQSWHHDCCLQLCPQPGTGKSNQTVPVNVLVCCSVSRFGGRLDTFLKAGNAGTRGQDQLV